MRWITWWSFWKLVTRRTALFKITSEWAEQVPAHFGGVSFVAKREPFEFASPTLFCGGSGC